MTPLIQRLREIAAGGGYDATTACKEAADELERLIKSRNRNLQATVDKAKPEQIAKFWSLVDKSGGEDACWPWKGRCNKDGYGHVWIGGKADKRAHRVACALMGKVQPPDTVADHLCRERSCCNPKHIEFVPQGINMARGASPWAKNAAKTHCSKGHEFTPENTAMYQGPSHKRAYRVCLTCRPTYWRFAVVPRDPPPGAHKR